MKHLPIKYFALVLALFSAACSNTSVKETLGLKKSAPDEFMVLSHPSLTVPPNFALAAPGDVTHEFDSDSLRSNAQSTLLGSASSKALPSNISRAETAFLKKAETDKADPKIREALREEREVAIEEKTEKDESIIDGMLSSIRPKKGDPVIDATSEQKRLSENKKTGKAVNEGDVEVIDPKKKGIIDLNL